MRTEFGKLPITGTVVIGEGQKDEAPELYVGEMLGPGGWSARSRSTRSREPTSSPVATTARSPICVIGEPGGVMARTRHLHARSSASGATARGRVDIDAPMVETLEVVARCYGRRR